MLGTVDSSLNLSSLPVAKDWTEKTYALTVRRFKGAKGGSIEVCTKRVNMVARKHRGDLWCVHNPVKLKAESEVVLPSEDEQREIDQNNRDRSIRRARQAVRWQVKAIAADHLLTLSYRENMEDVDRLKTDWKRFVRLLRSGLPATDKFRAHKGLDRFQFVACREKQDRGAWHLHIAVKGRQDINFLRRCWFVAAGGNQDDEGAETVGAVNVRGPSKRWGSATFAWKTDKLAGYMTKYMHKSFDELNKGEKRYWSGRGNEKPETVRIWLACETFYDAVKATHDFGRDNGIKEMTLWASDGWDVMWCSG